MLYLFQLAIKIILITGLIDFTIRMLRKLRPKKTNPSPYTNNPAHNKGMAATRISEAKSRYDNFVKMNSYNNQNNTSPTSNTSIISDTSSVGGSISHPDTPPVTPSWWRQGGSSDPDIPSVTPSLEPQAKRRRKR